MQNGPTVFKVELKPEEKILLGVTASRFVAPLWGHFGHGYLIILSQ